MRRTLLLLALMATATLLASGIALALNDITCPNRTGNLCVGTNDQDVMTGSADADVMRGRGGDDTINASEKNDRLSGDAGNDQLSGDAGSDRYLFAQGWGQDTIVSETSGERDRVKFKKSTTGVDIALDDQHPSIGLGASSGTNTVAFPSGVIEGAFGGSGSDKIAGSSSANRLVGNGGSDTLESADGNDYLNGGADDDTLRGGAGDDDYRPNPLRDPIPGHDLINDASGSADSLNLGDRASSGATFTPRDGADADSNYEDLSIEMGEDIVLIRDYFDNSRARVSVSGAGTGLIESIAFSDGTLGFNEVKNRISSGEAPLPVATDDTETTDEDTAKVIDVLANDTGQNLSVKASSLGDPANGTAALITAAGPNQGKVRYTPDPDYNNTAANPDTFTYEACDDVVPPECDGATVSVTVNPVNEVPTISAIADQTVDEDSDTGEIAFTIGDADSTADALTLTGTSSNTTLVPTSNIVFGGTGASPTVKVTPATDKSGTATIEVKVEDQDGGFATESFELTVDPVNDAPIANDDTKSTPENTPLVFPASDLLTNDSEGADDEGAQALSVSEVSNPLNGTVDLTAGEITFTPEANYAGSASFAYTVCDDGTPQACSTETATVNVTVSRVNSKPLAQDGTASMDEDAAPVQIDLRSLVSDAETADANLTYNIVSGPTVQQGTLTPDSGTAGLYSFDSAHNFNGTVEISYKVTDRGDPDACGTPGQSCEAPQDSDTKTVTITVNSVLDPPVISSGGTLSYTENDAPSAVNGGLSVAHPEGAQITEATVQITANYQSGQDVLAFTDNSASDNIAQSGNFDSATGKLTLTGSGSAAEYEAALQAVTYKNTSENPSNATRTVSFLATDANSATSNPATRDISVTAVDDPPVAVNDSATVQEDDAATAVTVLSNDTDVDDGPKTISSATDPANGTVVLTGGSPATGLTYRPDPNYCNDPPASNLDTFTYNLNGGSQGTVSITVTCVNDAPVADDETFNGASSAVPNTSLVGNDPDDGAPDPSGPQKTISGDLLAGDTDIDGPGPLTIRAETKSTNDGGSVVIESDGDFTFHPKAGTSCTDNSDFFDYTVSDQNTATRPNTEGTDTGRVTISLTSSCVWYVDNAAGTNGDGRSNSPFNTLSNLNNSATDADGDGNTLFLYQGSGDYTGGLTLENNQKLYSQRHGLVVPDGGGASGTTTLVSAGPTNAKIVNGSGNALTLASGNDVQGIDLGNASGAALSGTSVGTATMDTATNGSINNATGKAVDISNGNLNMAFNAVSSSGSSTDGIRLDNTSGTFGASAGLLQNASDQDIDISGDRAGTDNVAFTYDGTITDDVGALVNVSGQTGGTKDFNGAISDGNDGDGSGISLTNNSGARVRFDGGVTLSTGTNAALAATGGGEVVVTDPATADNTIATTTGTALTVTNTTIGSDRLTFKSISANGAPNGIVLNNTGTSGGLTVTGDGATANSGGTITQSVGSTSDAAIAGKAVYLANTSNVNLRFMRLSVTSGNASGIIAVNLSGTNGIEKSVVDFNNTTPPSVPTANAFGLRVANTNTNATITVDATTFQNKRDGTTAVSYSIMGNSQVTVNVQDSNTADTFESKYTNLFGSGIVMGAGDDAGSTAKVFFNVSNTKFLTAPANGLTNLEMTVQQNATLVPAVTNNTFDKVGLPLAIVGVINVNTTGSGRLGDNSTSALFSGNTVTNIKSGPGPGFAYDPAGTNGYYGMRLAIDGNAGVHHKVKILNNTFTNIARTGIYVSARGQVNNANVQVDGNTVGTTAAPVGTANVRGVHVETQTQAVLNIDVTNNGIVNAGSSGSNSALHLRSGVDNNTTATINATVLNNTIGNTNNASGNFGRFRAQTLGTSSGLTSPAGNMCLDLRNNVLDTSGRTFELIHESGGTFGRLTSGNTGTISQTGTFANASSCTRPSL